VTVLKIPSVDSPETAVRIVIARRSKKQDTKMSTKPMPGDFYQNGQRIGQIINIDGPFTEPVLQIGQSTPTETTMSYWLTVKGYFAASIPQQSQQNWHEIRYEDYEPLRVFVQTSNFDRTQDTTTIVVTVP
jgi:hypothetical protein